MKEVWRTIPGHEKYDVSSLGNVRRKKNMRTLTPNARSNKSSYMAVCLAIGANKTKTCLVHRLVALAFINNPNNKPQVNHKDGNKRNNQVENLEWCTRSENAIHSYDILKHTPNRNPIKLTVEDVINIRELCKTSMRQADIAKRFNIGREMVCSINTRKAWAHI